jgi:hypothetical protein
VVRSGALAFARVARPNDAGWTVAVVDISDPARPEVEQADLLPQDLSAVDLAVSGDILAVTVTTQPRARPPEPPGAVLLFALDAGSLPSLVGRHDDAAWILAAGGPPGSATLYGAGDGWLSLDVRDPSQPVVHERFDELPIDTPISGPDRSRLVVDAAGRPYVVTATSFGGGLVVSPARASGGTDARGFMRTFPVLPAGGLAVSRGVLVYSHVGGRVELLDTAQPDPILQRRELLLPGTVAGVAVDASGDASRLYAAVDQGGLATIDITQPTTPTLRGMLMDHRHRPVLSVADGVAVVANGGQEDVFSTTFDVFDVAADVPRHTAAIARWQDSRSFWPMARSGRILWTGEILRSPGGEVAFTVGPWDLTIPETPMEVGGRPAVGAFYDLAMDADRLAIAQYHPADPAAPQHTTLLQVSDVSDPAAPVRLKGDTAVSHGVAYVPGLPLVGIEGNTVLVVTAVDWEGSGGRTFTLYGRAVRDSGFPRVDGALDLPGATNGLELADGYAFLSTPCRLDGDRCAVFVVDARDPGNPAPAAWLGRGGGGPTGVAVNGEEVYVAGGPEGIWVYRPALAGWGRPTPTVEPTPATPGPPVATATEPASTISPTPPPTQPTMQLYLPSVDR